MPFLGRGLIVSLYCILGLLVLAQAQEVPAVEEQPDCSIEGDEGLYGIGVRLGIYFQFFASMFTLAFQRDQGPAFLYAAAALQAALFVALMYASAKEHLYAAEALVAILLLIIMILFECLVFISIFIHLLSGHFRFPKTDRDSSTVVESISGIGVGSTFEQSKGDETKEKADEIKDHRAVESDDSSTITSSSSSSSGLTRQKTRLAPTPEQAKLNLREAIYASDPLLISDDNMILIARTIKNYTEMHVWASAGAIYVLIYGSYIYMMWFWWRGLPRMRSTPCGTHGFFVFASFDINHWISWPIKIVLIVAGLFLLAGLAQTFCTFLSFCAVIVIQNCERTTGFFTKRFVTVQKMKDFYDRVNLLRLPLTHEYILLVMIYRSYLSHWPDRLFLRMFGKDPQKQREMAEKRSQFALCPKARRKAKRLKQASQTGEEGDASKTESTNTNLDPSASEASQPQRIESDEGSEVHIALRLADGTAIKSSEFFHIGNPPTWRLSWSNKIAHRLLKPGPSRLTDSARGEHSDISTYIRPYADNFETLTLPLVVILFHVFYFVVIGIVLAAGIWSVELTIRKNNIAGVHHLPSTAQLIPFMIGVGSFVLSGFSALGSFGAWWMFMRKLGRGSRSWFDAVVERFFYETDADDGGINVEYMRHSPAMLVIWMFLPSFKKGQSMEGFRKEFQEEMDEKGGLFVLDLFD